MSDSSTADHLTPLERKRLIKAFPDSSQCISRPKELRRARILKMPLNAFFTPERLCRFGPSARATRVVNAVNRQIGYDLPEDARTVGDLVDRVGYLGLLRSPNLGRGSVDLMRDALEAEGISLPNHPHLG